MKKYNSFDLTKFIMAIVVIDAHTRHLKHNTLDWINRMYNACTLLAVPFFFVTAGFLLGKKMNWPYTDNASLAILKKYILRMVKLYLLWSIIYFPLALVPYISDQYSVSKSVLHYIHRLLLVGDHYNSAPLWYLLSTIYGLVLMYILLSKKVPAKLIAIVFLVVIPFSWACDWITATERILPVPVEFFRKMIRISILKGRIFRGAYFLPIGMALAHRTLNVKKGAVLFVLGYLGNLVFPFMSLPNNFFAAICALGLFTIIERIDLKDSPLYAVFRKMSTVMYFTHMYIWTFYYYIRYKEKTYSVDCFLATTIVSILISIVYILISNRISKKVSSNMAV